MTKDNAIARAEAYVAARYPMVPKVISVRHFVYLHGRLVGKSWHRRPGTAVWHEADSNFDFAAIEAMLDDARMPIDFGAMRDTLRSGRWSVSFFMSCDTDEQGMPQTLNLLIDDADGSIAEIGGLHPRRST